MTIFPLIYSTLQINIKNNLFKSNLLIIILLITYTVTLKAFFILNFLFLVSFLFLYDFKKIFNLVIFSKTFVFSIVTIFLLISVNIAYTGCAIYPVQSTCLSNQLSWALEKDHVAKMYNWYQQWSKSGHQALSVLKTLKNISKVLIGFLIGMKGIFYINLKS